MKLGGKTDTERKLKEEDCCTQEKEWKRNKEMLKRSCKKSRLSKDELWALLDGVNSCSPKVRRWNTYSKRTLSKLALLVFTHPRDNPFI